MEFPAGSDYKETVRMLDALQAKSAPPERQLTGSYHLTGLTQARRIAETTVLRFMESNTIFRQVEKGAAEMEAEVISMIGSLWGLKGEAPGFMTSGGTESNITALYAMRSRSKRKRGSVVFPSTIHPTVWKACHILGLEPVVVEAKEDFTADVGAIERALRRDTVGIAATCGTIPWGTIDPIRALGKLAEERSLYLHVDAAWGGLICPWLKELGYDIPDFGFKNRGVSSISSDPHKQAFSVHPAGAIVFRDAELQELVTWSATRAGRKYTSRGMMGSRPGAPVAATWALMHFLGRRGYLDLSGRCMRLTTSFVRRVREIQRLEIGAEPKMNMASVVSTSLDMEDIKGKLRERGWFFLEANGPSFTRLNALAIGPEPYHRRVLPLFLADLESAAAGTKKPLQS